MFRSLNPSTIFPGVLDDSLTSMLSKTQIMLPLTSYYSLHHTLCGLDMLVVVLEIRAALAVKRNRRRKTQKGLSQDH